MNDYISDKDKTDWDNFINSKEKLPNKDINQKDRKTKKIRSIDLHGYTLDQANKTIESFIKNRQWFKSKWKIYLDRDGLEIC